MGASHYPSTHITAQLFLWLGAVHIRGDTHRQCSEI